MPPIKYGYQYNAAPILDWSRYPPQQTKAADAKTLGYLGSLSGSSIGDGTSLPLPVPGGPEPMGDCSCTGTCGCKGLGDLEITSTTMVLLGVAGFIAFRMLKKRKR